MITCETECRLLRINEKDHVELTSHEITRTNGVQRTCGVQLSSKLKRYYRSKIHRDPNIVTQLNDCTNARPEKWRDWKKKKKKEKRRSYL